MSIYNQNNYTKCPYSHTAKPLRVFLCIGLFVLFLAGCEQESAVEANKGLNTGQNSSARTKIPAQANARRVSELGEIVAYNSIPVEGYGLVGGLAGKGSTDCPVAVREYLRGYILKQLPKDSDISADGLINSKDTAAVHLYGLIPPAGVRGETFDILVTSVTGTQVTSLEGGYLYESDLRRVTRFGRLNAGAMILASAEGPVFVGNYSETVGDPLIGHVLGGGLVNQDHETSLALFEPDYMTAALIRDRINGRFGNGTAVAMNESLININIPPKYEGQKVRFLSLVRSLYIDTESLESLINSLVKTLRDKPSMRSQAITSLEAIGRPAIDKLKPLLDSPDQEVRYYAAQCLLAVGDYSGYEVLTNIAFSPNSEFRIAAINSIGYDARRNNASAIMTRLLAAPSLQIRLSAYKHMDRLQDISISRTIVANDLFIDRLAATGPKTIYITQQETPKVVLMGSPIYANRELYIESNDGQIIATCSEKAPFVRLIRRHPKRGSIIGPLKSSREIGDIVRTLCESPAQDKSSRTRPGLGLSYSQAVEFLKKMSEMNAVDAEFHIENKPEIYRLVKRNTPIDR